MTIARDLVRIGRLALQTGRRLIARPASFRAWQWALFALFVSVVMITFVEKRPLQAAVEAAVDGPVARAAARFANAVGGGVPTVGLGVLSYVVGRVARKESLASAAILLAAAGVWCFALTTIGQFVFAEGRPFEGGAMAFFERGGHGVSGHASAAALLATIYASLARSAWPKWGRAVAILFATWAVFVGWSRVWLGAHHVWNVLLGLAIGWLTARAAIAAARDLHRNKEEP